MSIEITIDELVKKIISGERDLSGIRVKWSYRPELPRPLLVYPEFLELNEYLKGQDLENDPVVMNNSDLPSLVASGIYLPYLKARGTYLNGASLGGANLYRADLTGASLGGANLERADLREANLQEVKRGGGFAPGLFGINLSRANLYRANLYRANLYRAELYGANLYRANLEGANLASASLVEANLKEANLKEVNLGRAFLWQADLRGATGLETTIATRTARLGFLFIRAIMTQLEKDAIKEARKRSK